MQLDAHGRLTWTERSGGTERVWHGEPDASLRRRAMAFLARALPIESQL
ncbi:hypothetical protein [Siccirubricoccus sp. G192]|nr:hypothetical protein [Siccirubricoccus sp. G192]MBV1798259.1 hypothetical protein [Siccirubricoccus sp. G192]